MTRGVGPSDPDRSLLLVIEALRRDAGAAPPEPRLELAEIFREGFGAVAPVLTAPEPTRTSRPRALARVAFTKLAGLGLVAQLGLGAAAGATGLTVAAATDSLPAAVQDPVASVVERVVPGLDLPDSGDAVLDAPGLSEYAPGTQDLTPGQQGTTPADGGDPPGHAEEPGNSGNAPAHGRDAEPGAVVDTPAGTGADDAPGAPAEGEQRGNPDAPGKPADGETRGKAPADAPAKARSGR